MHEVHTHAYRIHKTSVSKISKAYQTTHRRFQFLTLKAIVIAIPKITSVNAITIAIAIITSVPTVVIVTAIIAAVSPGVDALKLSVLVGIVIVPTTSAEARIHSYFGPLRSIVGLS